MEKLEILEYYISKEIVNEKKIDKDTLFEYLKTCFTELNIPIDEDEAIHNVKIYQQFLEIDIIKAEVIRNFKLYMFD
jgi:hypothetical protein